MRERAGTLRAGGADAALGAGGGTWGRGGDLGACTRDPVGGIGLEISGRASASPAARDTRAGMGRNSNREKNVGFGEPLTYLTRPLAWTAPWLRPMRFSRAKTPRVKQRSCFGAPASSRRDGSLVPRRTGPRSWGRPFCPSRRLALTSARPQLRVSSLLLLVLSLISVPEPFPRLASDPFVSHASGRRPTRAGTFARG